MSEGDQEAFAGILQAVLVYYPVGKAAGLSVREIVSAGSFAANNIPLVIEPKIAQQMGSRGWTNAEIASTISNPARKVVTKDTRFDPISGTRLNDPATGYIARDSSYVVKNDKTGQIVQISNKNDPNWKAPW